MHAARIRENRNRQQTTFTVFEWPSAYSTPACKWGQNINIHCKEIFRECGVDYSGSELGPKWIKVEKARTDERIITKYMSKRNRLCGHVLGGPASRLGKLAGSCEQGNEHLSP